MRTIVTLFLCVLLVACNNASDKEMMVEEASEVLEFTIPYKVDDGMVYTSIVRVKFQELMDLQALALTHPYDNAIRQQITEMTDSLQQPFSQTHSQLLKFEVMSPIVRVNDTVQHLNIVYQLEGTNTSEKTTIAVITTTQLIIDGKEQDITSIKFRQ